MNNMLYLLNLFLSDQSIDNDNIYDVRINVMSSVCYEYYKKVKYCTTISKKFLKHLKKVGSYIESLIYHKIHV